MAFAPRYSIVPCCPDLGTPTASFQIPGGPVPNGVYVYNGPTLPPDSGVTFQTGYCYTIIDLGPYPTGAPIAPDFSNFETARDCFDNKCIACAIATPYAFQVYACCDTETTITLNISGAVLGMDSTVNQYIGTIPFEVNGFIFVPGECYHFTFAGSSQEPDGPTIDNFVATGDFCETAVGCPTCPPAPQYLRFVSCCDNTTIYLRPDDNSTYLPGVYEYLGTPTVGLENICYSVTLYSVGVAPINNIGDYGGLFEAPAFIENVTFSTLSNTNTNCDNYILDCPSCTPTCYTLYNCDGLFRNTTADLSAYVGTFVSISNVDGPIEGTWFVLINTGNCNNAIEDITVDVTPPEPCDCRCFEVIGITKSITYVDCDGNLIKTLGPAKFCSLVYPLVTGVPGQYQVSEGDNCVDGACPIKCYELTECNTGEVITSQSQSLSQYYITGQVIELVGQPGCWEVTSDAAEDCTCPIDVTVTIVHEDCPTCLGITAYKLTGCENANDIKYTYDDLSEYVGQTLRTDCGCYTVELIDFQPTSTSPIVIISSFNNCTECLRIYYKLTDCNGVENPIYTFTDLSGYAGEIINIKGCDTCFEIEETDVPINPTIVTVTNSFERCGDCTPPLPCLCNRMTNYSTSTKEYEYIDCNDDTVLLTLAAGESSGKICLKRWVIDYPDTDNLEIFGDCQSTETTGVYVCPIVTPKKKVKPGYSVPSCDIEKYEKITCKSSEIYYKQVMRLRYGISNCCPEDEEKWLVKKELIDLVALIDPDYTCVPVTTCCSQPISSCGCGCNQPLKTCNS